MFNKILIANRSEIAIRIARAAGELDIKTVGVYAEQDSLSLHRFSMDEACLVGVGKKPIDAYLDIDDMIRIALETGCDAVHPGYGFLSENPGFADKCAEHNIVFVGPRPEVMRSLGNKVQARELAMKADVPVMPATNPLPEDEQQIIELANQVGFPVMLKASWGGGGRGMRVIESQDQLLEQVNAGRREAQSAFGNGEVYLEKLIRNARHVEVQIIGDQHGNVVHLFERDCSIQRRHQKVVERAPAPYLDQAQREEICQAARRLTQSVSYSNAGTVEFLQDVDTGEFYFIEVNPRVQVEHTVTEQITGIDIVKAQICIAGGAEIGDVVKSGVPQQADIQMHGAALQCRITTEDPRNQFIPDYGTISAYRSPAGPGIRLDGGSAYAGAVITRHYDSLLVKVTASGLREDEAVQRMQRALSEFKVRGLETNIVFLRQLLSDQQFLQGNYNTRFIDESPHLLVSHDKQSSGAKLMNYIGEVIVNGNVQVNGRAIPQVLKTPQVPQLNTEQITASPQDGVRQILQKQGPQAVAQWLKEQSAPLITDTTFRDAHQSLLATRMRSYDMLQIAPHYAKLMPNLFSVESWGGATFDVSMRFLAEDPWQRLADLSEKMPNLMQQMLLRASNAVGYKNYPDNVVKYFVERSAEAGVDVFRIFDSLNWIENMRGSIEYVASTGKIAEAAICYTGDLLDPKRSKYDLKYYVELAKQLEQAGAHILGIKDMAGLLKPAAAKVLISTLKQEVGLPIHLHTHDTSGIAGASILAAVDAGVDAFDAAMDSMSGLTSQPCMGSLVTALQGSAHDTQLDLDNIRLLSEYWEQVRTQYAAFEPDLRSGASEVYLHEMPGGQFTNLKEQAAALGIDGQRWHKVAKAYADVNMAFGDIVKVTPSSKVVGDMAIMMVTSDITIEDVLNPDKDIAFPESVVSLMAGDLGQPPGGFPTGLQQKVLKDRKAYTDRPGSLLPSVDLEQSKTELNQQTDFRNVDDNDLASSLMYPKVFTAFRKVREKYGDLSILPTHTYFYGMQPREELTLTKHNGQQVVIRHLTTTEPDVEGYRRVFFELNGQPSAIKVLDNSLHIETVKHEQADPSNQKHIAAPMPGSIATIAVEVGQKVQAGDRLLSMEAMKMETSVNAEIDGVIKRVLVEVGSSVDAKNLLVELE